MKPQLKKTLALSGLFAASVAVSHAQYYLAGDFQGWNPSGNPMTAGPNANEYSYTLTGTPGGYANVKVTDGTWNNTWPSGNMLVKYDTTGSATVHFWPGTFSDGWKPTANRVGYDDPDNDLGWGIAGDFNGWDGSQSPMTSLGNGLYTNTVTPAAASSHAFKFQSPAGNWSNINFGGDFGNGGANAGFLTLGPSQTLPVQLDLPNGRWLIPSPPPPTNFVTFQIDMSAQVLLKNFTNGDPNASITVSGDFEGWDNGLKLTNNPTLSGSASNVYSCVAPVVSYLPGNVNYKFRMNSGWESPASTAGGNRQATITSGTQVLPLVYYNDNSTYDLVATPVTVAFTLYMPNGTVDKNGYAFDNTSDSLWINGDFINNWNSGTWPGPSASFSAAQQMVEVGTSDYYTNSFVIPAGNSIYLSYKYSIDSTDDENGFATNHVREIRTYGTTYTMPVDSWSWSVVKPGIGYPNAGITSTNVVEPDYGFLNIQPKVGDSFPINWLGRPGVVLLNTASLTSGNWQTNNSTDGNQSANWPSSGSAQFFKLLKKK